MIYICGLQTVVAGAERVKPRHLISLTDPGTPAPVVPGLEHKQHLKLTFHDIDVPRPDSIAPQKEHIEQIIAFATDWDRQHPLLVHCHAGVSRSTAAAIIVQALTAEGRERDVAHLLRARAPHANPNRRMIALADELLDRNGQLIEAVAAMGPPTAVAKEGCLVELWLEP